MQLSRAADYAVRAMLDVASQGAGAVVLTREIARRQDIPLPFLAKIIPRLGQAGLLHTYRGALGGVALACPASEVSLHQIIEAVEGPIALNRCTIRPGACPRDTFCAVHAVWAQAQTALNRLLDSALLSDLVQQGRGEPALCRQEGLER
ncbi:MAG: Rrf2 family transcriptional regulator [Chloroflexota bacterium]